MEYRAGKCSQCGAEYQIPASFAHNVARCKKCKSGVVHLSAAARGPAAATAPAVEPPRVASPGTAPGPRATTPAPHAAEASPVRPARQPSPPAVTTEAPGAMPAHEERAPIAQGKRSLTPILLGLGLAALAVVLFLLRARIFGAGESAGTPSAPAAASPGPAKDGTLPDDG
jgi:DNA-directed RNA polymerase subunit RPC12/RpoP